MKYKTTKRDVKAGYGNVICVGYCNLQNLLSYESETAYTTRREGWGADIYQFGNTAIVTGYAPFGNIRPSYDVCQKYERKAGEIPYTLSYKERKEALNKLISEFIEEVTQ